MVACERHPLPETWIYSLLYHEYIENEAQVLKITENPAQNCKFLRGRSG